jgi:hypothetical protein
VYALSRGEGQRHWAGELVSPRPGEVARHSGGQPPVDGELLPACSREKAEQITQQIRNGVESLLNLLREAWERRAWLALDYASWTAYVEDVLGDVCERLTKDERKQTAELLAESGLSTRPIAELLGVSQSTASRLSHPPKPESYNGDVSQSDSPSTGNNGDDEEEDENAELARAHKRLDAARTALISAVKVLDKLDRHSLDAPTRTLLMRKVEGLRVELGELEAAAEQLTGGGS